MATNGLVQGGVNIFPGNGELAQRMRDFDWSSTPVGPPDRWPIPLRTAVSIMLTSRQPIWIGWGPELTFLYNDAYKSIIGGKHPQMLCRPCSVVWREIWDVISPMLAKAMTGVEGTYVESQLLIMERHGYQEETYYTFSYSPIFQEDGSVGGIICANTEDTGRVLGERQLQLLRDLAAVSARARTWRVSSRDSIEALRVASRDFPFALLYVGDAAGQELECVGRLSFPQSHPAAPERIDIENDTWPIARVLRERTLFLHDLKGVAGDPYPTGGWSAPPLQAVIVPIRLSRQGGRRAVLILGLNPYRAFDAAFQGFVSLVATQISSNITGAQAFEGERRRAEALAELDKAKTSFFSNVSHEFRTPLTLMLGPIEDMLYRSSTDVPDLLKGQLEVAHRNGLRMLKLVNAMLDFSRIEAGGLQVRYEPIDISALTRDLASTFRSAVELAGLRLEVDCPSLARETYVDPDMWEKIVVNLLGNAYKFTHNGEIGVKLEGFGSTVRLTVWDTGIGIPEREKSRIFQRFHRVESSRGRTQEGTGIGLALVQELVRLHNGTIEFSSEVDKGSTFVVEIPAGRDHIAEDQIHERDEPQARGAAARAFVGEAMRWLPDARTVGQGQREQDSQSGPAGGRLEVVPPASGSRQRILIADDNTDMREYVTRLLRERFDVEVASDGLAALEAARARTPDLVVSDIMMPRLDGLQLLRALREDPTLKAVPVILLSARAGEDARIEGAEGGADDYLTKPFNGRELVARVDAQIKLALFRRHAVSELNDRDERFHQFMRHLPGLAWIKRLDGRYVYVNEQVEAAFGRPAREICGKSDHDLFPEATAVQFAANDLAATESANGMQIVESLKHPDGTLHHSLVTKFVIATEGEGALIAGVAIDITARTEAERRIAALNFDLRRRLEEQDALLNSLPVGVFIAHDREGRTITGNPAGAAMLRMPAGPNRGELAFRVTKNGVEVPDAELPLRRCARLGEAIRDEEYDVVFEDGTSTTLLEYASPLFDESQQPRGCVAVFIDVTERKNSERRQELLIDELNHRVKNMLAVIQSIASQTLRQEPDPSAFKIAFSARLSALARAHSMLTRSLWQGALLSDVAATALSPFTESGRANAISIEGPELTVAPNAAITLTLMLHELATNAMKYGALSASGRVMLSWDFVDADAGSRLELSWVERDGPPASAPTRSGFGSRLLQVSAEQLGGSLEVAFAREGFRCCLVVPSNADWISVGGHGFGPKPGGSRFTAKIGQSSDSSRALARTVSRHSRDIADD